MDAIGIGCFWFAAKKTDGDLDDFSPFKHIDDIKDAIEDIDNVSDFKIFGDGHSVLGFSYLDLDEDFNFSQFFLM